MTFLDSARSIRSALAALAAVIGVSAPVALTAQPTPYHVAGRFRVGGEGGWDYLTFDSASRRLFLSRGSHVMVVDPENGRVVGDVPNTPGVHGVALAPELGRGFTSNGRDSSVTIFDYTTLAPVGRVTITGRNPDAILYDPATKRVFAFNGASASATAIDAASGAVVGTVPLGGKPESAVTDGTGRVLVNVEDRSEIVAFDAATLALRAHWPLAPCEEPTGLAIDRAHMRLFAGCGNRILAVVSATTGAVVATIPVGQGVDASAFDPATQLAFVSAGDGTLTVVHEDAPDAYTVVETVQTQRGARTMALDPTTHAVYLATADYGPAPVPTPANPRPRPPIVPGSFTVLVVRR